VEVDGSFWAASVEVGCESGAGRIWMDVRSAICVSRSEMSEKNNNLISQTP